MDETSLVVRRWIEKASRDLRTAQIMLGVADVPTDVVCFHCQQGAEKALKGFLASVGQDVPRTHDLTELLTLCRQHDERFGPLEERAMALADYAVEVRYIDDWRDIPLDEAIAALGMAAEIMNFVRRKLGLEGSP